MRIGIDLFSFDPGYSGGVSTFAAGLVNGLAEVLEENDSLTILCSPTNEQYLRDTFQHFSLTYLSVSVEHRHRLINEIFPYVSWALRSIKLRYWYDKYFRVGTMTQVDNAVDIVIVPTTVLNFYALNIPSVLCIHDIQHEYLPHFFSFKQRVIRWSPYRLSCLRSAAIQASSIYIKNCLLEKFTFIETEKIFLAHEGVDLKKFFLGAKADIPALAAKLEKNNFVFYPAQLWAHKNHLLLVDALASFRDSTGEELQCVMTGADYDHRWDQIDARIQTLGLEKIYYLGKIDFSQILWLYQNCRAVLALGLHESSSLPIREGAAFGKKLICSNIPPNIEVQDFLQVTLVDMHDPNDLANAFVAMNSSESEDSKDAENARLVRMFEWTVIAVTYYETLKRILTKETNGNRVSADHAVLSGAEKKIT